MTRSCNVGNRRRLFFLISVSFRGVLTDGISMLNFTSWLTNCNNVSETQQVLIVPMYLCFSINNLRNIVYMLGIIETNPVCFAPYLSTCRVCCYNQPIYKVWLRLGVKSDCNNNLFRNREGFIYLWLW